MAAEGKARVLTISDVKDGDSWEESVCITQERLQQFIDLSADVALAHVDPNHARRMGFDRVLVHGFLVALPYSRILGMFLPGSMTVIHSIDLKMPAPVFVGDTITYRVEVTRVVAAVGSVLLGLTATNQDGVVVSQGKANCVFREDARGI